jgi:peptidoglycan/LPS O-acetylase OafA/YrhL
VADRQPTRTTRTGQDPAPRRHTAASAPRSRTLAEAFDARRNNLNALRLLLATAVLASHSWSFVRGEDDPLGRTGGPDIGEVAVDGFFLISGFLIARSDRRAPSTGRYLWHRFLRIMPAFWVCLVVTAFAVGPLLWWAERGSAAGYPWAGADSALTYVLGNAVLRMTQFNIGDLRGGEALDGSLHTLFFEALCYLMIGLLGAAGFLRRRQVVVLALAGGCWLLAGYDAVSGSSLLADSYTLRFASIFLVGSVMFLYADRIPLSRPLLWASLLLLAASLAVPATYLLLGPPAFAYLLLYMGVGHRFSRVGARRDLSYGIYIYAWPVQLLLLEAGVGDRALALHILASLAASVLAAAASWRLIEAPALSLKARPLRARRAPAPATLPGTESTSV